MNKISFKNALQRRSQLGPTFRFDISAQFQWGNKRNQWHNMMRPTKSVRTGAWSGIPYGAGILRFKSGPPSGQSLDTKKRGEKTTRNPLVHQQQSSSGGFRCQVTSTLSHPFYLSFPLFEFGALRHLGSPKVVVWPITDLVSFLHFLTFSFSLISGQPIHLFNFNFKWKFSFKNWLLEEGESNTLVASVQSMITAADGGRLKAQTGPKFFCGQTISNPKRRLT